MALSGVDVHDGQGAIEWHRVAAAGHKFAFIRAAYGDFRDKLVVQNYHGVKDAGMACGLYHFYRTTRTPAAQADLMIATLKGLGYGTGDLPPVIDVEDNPGFDGPWKTANNSKYLDGLRSWISALSKAFNCTPIIYTRASFWRQIGNPDDLTKYPLWVANYEVQKPQLPKGWSDYTFWQYSESGTADGISGGCDLNHFNGDQAALGRLRLP
jgi:lysozyme